MLSQMLEQFASLSEVLIWITGIGGMIIFGAIKARVLENWVAWHNFPTWVKKSAPAIFAGILALGANALLSFEIVNLIPESVAVFILFGINYLVGQKEYESIKESGYAESTRLEANGG